MFRRQHEPDVVVDGDTVTLEGPDLEEILAEAHRRCGDDAEILSADRDIVGGVGGFFGREHFVVVARAAPGAGTAGDDPGADSSEAGRAGDAGDHPPDATTASDEGDEGAGDLRLDGASFAAALAEALARQGGDPAGDGPGGHPARTLEDLLEDLDTRDRNDVGAAPPPEAPPAAAAPPPVPGEPVDEAVDAVLDPVVDPVVVEAVAERPAGVVPPAAAVVPTPPADAPVPPTVPPGPADAAGPTTAGAGTARPAPVPTVAPLALPDLPLGELLDRVEARTGTPVLPPARGIVAVVGDADDALLTAQRLARRSGGDPDEGVVLLAPEARDGQAPWLVVSSPTMAAVRRKRWARRPHATFVAVTLDPGPAGVDWVRQSLTALEPDQVRYAAPAWRCADELAPRVAAIGAVDAVDLVHLGSAVDPSEFLGMTPPVSTLDGRPAEAGLWAAHLMAAPAPRVAMELLGGTDGPAGRVEQQRRRGDGRSDVLGARP